MAETAGKSEVRRADYLSRSEALQILGIKQQTLYCYVSRGYIRSVPQSDGRSSFYLREDVEKVKAKSIARSGHGPAAAAAMRWGEPVILTAITELTPAGPRYRSRLATDLARDGASFESVAEYLWTGEWTDQARGWDLDDACKALPELLAAQARLDSGDHVLELLSAATLYLGMAEADSGDASRLSARRLIRCMTGVFGFLGASRSYAPLQRGEPIGQGLARALSLASENTVATALNTALVLVADHELNPATFAARVAASSGADLHACIAAALGVHGGSLIGRVCERVEDLFARDSSAAAIESAARRRVGSAQKLPGFNHPLYPHGDPRTRMLIELARELGGDTEPTRTMLQALQRIEGGLEAKPMIEAGLVVLCRALGAPDRTAAGLFALGRCAGWVAHILEQRQQGFMIRPRAQFTAAAGASSVERPDGRST